MKSSLLVLMIRKLIRCTWYDEIFGRRNFVVQLAWGSDGNFDNQGKIKIYHEDIQCYIKNPDFWG